jgi:hypothetical protein
MRAKQTLVEKAEEVLCRQTRAQVQRTGQSRADARPSLRPQPAASSKS